MAQATLRRPARLHLALAEESGCAAWTGAAAEGPAAPAAPAAPVAPVGPAAPCGRAAAVPLSATSPAPVSELLRMRRVAVRVPPPACGLKRTPMSQLSPGATGPRQVSEPTKKSSAPGPAKS